MRISAALYEHTFMKYTYIILLNSNFDNIIFITGILMHNLHFIRS